ncbi:MAG: hypothetical protein Q9180_001492 [Flavoplaca navasiana]
MRLGGLDLPGPQGPGGPGRLAIFVGHDFNDDALNLESIIKDFSIVALKPLGAIDTHHTVEKTVDGREGIGLGLRDLVRRYDVTQGEYQDQKWEFRGAHNAGIDAYVNLCALLGMCLDPQLTYNSHTANFIASDGSLTLDLSKPVPFPYLSNPIFICIDFEHKEYADDYGHKPITEIGIATLDTLHIADIPPGDEKASNWIEKVEKDHVVVQEYQNWRQSAFNNGDPWSFQNLGYGKSEIINEDQLDDWLKNLLYAFACRKPAAKGALDLPGPQGPGGLAAPSQSGDDGSEDDGDDDSETGGNNDDDDQVADLIRHTCAHQLRKRQCKHPWLCVGKNKLCRDFMLVRIYHLAHVRNLTPMQGRCQFKGHHQHDNSSVPTLHILPTCPDILNEKQCSHGRQCLPQHANDHPEVRHAVEHRERWNAKWRYAMAEGRLGYDHNEYNPSPKAAKNERHRRAKERYKEAQAGAAAASKSS